MDRVKKAIVETWGERCPDVDAGCVACQAWIEFDAMVEACAREAVAYEVAANVCQHHLSTPEDVAMAETIAEGIRALTPDHTTEALDRIKADARDEGIKAAAHAYYEGAMLGGPDSWDFFKAAHDAILATLSADTPTT